MTGTGGGLGIVRVSNKYKDITCILIFKVVLLVAYDDLSVT